MSDYTPTTEEVRGAFVVGCDFSNHLGAGSDDLSDASSPEFDRWLNEVKAQVWEEGWHTGNKDSDGLQPTVNPYREET